MKILYIANIRLPTEKAHGVQIMKMCEAFAELGHEVELIVTDRATSVMEDPFTYYEIRTRFPITRLRVVDAVGLGRWGFLLESWSFARAANRLLKERRPDLVFGRDELVLAHLRTDVPIVWESHDGRWNAAAKKLAARVRALVVTSGGQQDSYVAAGVASELIILAPNGIDLRDFERPESQDVARRRLGLPMESKMALYAGRFDGWKGTDVFFAAAARAPGVLFAAIGSGGDERALGERYPNVRFLGPRPYRELADNLAAADVLVIPNTGKSDISTRFTSPLKLFAYMAAGKPIVASDLPSIREVIDDTEAYFFTPDNPESLAAAVERAAGDPGASELALRAKEKVGHYSWAARAKKILSAIV